MAFYDLDWKSWSDVAWTFHAHDGGDTPDVPEPEEVLFAVLRSSGGYDPQAFVIGRNGESYFIVDAHGSMDTGLRSRDWSPVEYTLDGLIAMLEERFSPSTSLEYDHETIREYAVPIMKELWSRQWALTQKLP
jgi:hypothetical protein